MSIATLTDKDLRLREAVVQQLEWDPAVEASGVGVTAREGAVTLTGSINTYAGKLAAERAAKRVSGVRAIANDLEVKLAAGRSDADIAADAATMLKLHHEVPDSVQAAVHHGHLTLTGTVAGITNGSRRKKPFASSAASGRLPTGLRWCRGQRAAI